MNDKENVYVVIMYKRFHSLRVHNDREARLPTEALLNKKYMLPTEMCCKLNSINVINIKYFIIISIIITVLTLSLQTDICTPPNLLTHTRTHARTHAHIHKHTNHFPQRTKKQSC